MNDVIPSVAGWRCDPYAATDAVRLVEEFGLSPYSAAILSRRGFGTPEAARAFLEGEDRHDPMLVHGMSDACSMVLRHVEQGSPIVVFGDYDVDGVCATAIAVNVLRTLESNVSWRLPSRDEGYGLSKEAIAELADIGAKLLVTVDCGVTAVEEVALARSLGLDVIVTDHHRVEDDLPDCTVVHPALGDYPFKELCGAGVAFKLSEALRGAAGLDPAGAAEDADLAGLATVCDMVPLVGENRRIAQEGMTALAQARRPGLRALMRELSIDSADVDATTASFKLGPRINAAGRMQRADSALELVMTEDEERAVEVAKELEGLNHDRRERQQRAVQEAEKLCKPQLAQGAIVVAGEGWHAGVVGIVASQLVERFHRPCVVLALDGETARGSARSIPGYDIFEGLTAVSEHLVRHGGHAMAAGLEIATDGIDAFRAALAAHAGSILTPSQLMPLQHVDAVVPGDALTLELAEELERLGPFGAGNPSPVLIVPAARIEHVTSMGKEDEHARFSLRSGGARARGVAFNTSQRALSEAGATEHDVAVALECNRWNGTLEPRVMLKSVAVTPRGELEDISTPPTLVQAVEAEMEADPERWWSSSVAAASQFATPPRDRKDEGLSGVVGDLLSSGESVALVVTDVSRRREALETLVAGQARGGLPVLSWEMLPTCSGALSGFQHVVVPDPPPVAEGFDELAVAAGSALVHMAWGPPDREFSLACWRERLSLRPALVELWHALARSDELAGPALEQTLRGFHLHERDSLHCARLVRVICEMGLAGWDGSKPNWPVLRRISSEKTSVERSPAYRAYAARLEDAERHLGGGERRVAVATG